MDDWFLRTERLGFRLWREDDFPLAFALWGDPDVTKYFGGPFSAEWVEQRLAREIVTMSSLRMQYWPIFVLETGEHAGVCGLRPHDPAARIPALGFHLRKEHWGRGYAIEASRAVIDYAFNELDAAAIFAGHHPQNDRSRRVLESLGFQYTHDQLYPPTGLQHLSYLLQPQTMPKRGAQHDALEIFLGDWKAEGQSFGGQNQDPRNPRGNPTQWTSTHNARWHTGEFFLIQDERANVGGPFDTLSVMGWDDDAGRYFARTFENHGYYRHYHMTVEGNVWTISGKTERARIEFSDDGQTQTITWEWRPNDTWLPLCDRVATKV